jgi:hypothetical protein
MNILLISNEYLQNNAARERLSQMVTNLCKHDNIKHIKVIQYLFQIRASQWKQHMVISSKAEIDLYQRRFSPQLLFATMVPNPITFVFLFYITLKDIIRGKQDIIIISPPPFYSCLLSVLIWLV